MNPNAAFERYLTTSSTNTSFTLTANGHFLNAPRAAASPFLRLFPVDRGMAVSIIFFGAGSDNQTFDYRLWSVMQLSAARDVSGIGGSPAEYMRLYRGSGTCTLSTGVGATGGVNLTSSERLCDTVTWAKATTATTPTGPQELSEDAFAEGDITVYSPADNTPAMLMIPHFGRATSLMLEFDMTGATSGNALIYASPY